MECPACHTPNADGARFCAKCGALLPATPTEEADPLIGAVVGGRFRVVGVLGEGGMGRVYNGEQQMGTTVRKVAIKTLLSQYAKDPQVVARFMRECGTVAELEHPNTIKVYDFGQTPSGELYIAMELLSGEALEKTLERGPVAPERVDKILSQVCGSLEEAHNKGIVHRDLKPANIYLTIRAGEDDYVKVLDFGIAKRDEKHSKHEAKLTQQGTVLGTPPYMSPEQFRGQELDMRSDIYSLGVMAYEMLTGRLPFDADTPWAWATQHMTAQPFPFETVPLGSQVPAKMKAAVMRALSKDKNHRQQSVREFYDEFTMGGGRTTGLGMRASAVDLSAASIASGGGRTGPMAQAQTQQGAVISAPGGEHVSTPPPDMGYPSSPGMPATGAHAIGGVPTGSGQVIPPAPQAQPKKGSAGPIIGVVAVVGVLGLVGAVFAFKGKGGGKGAQGTSSATTATTPTSTTPTATPTHEPTSTATEPPTVDAGAPTQPTSSATIATPPTGTTTTPSLPGIDPRSAAACKMAETAANRDDLGAARAAFARCDGPAKVGARLAIDQAEIRAAKKHHPPHCPPGKRCPRR